MNHCQSALIFRLVISIYVVSDLDLERLLENLTTSLDSGDKDVQDLERRKIEETSQLQSFQQNLSEKYAQKGQYQAEEAAYQKMVIERETIAKSLMAKSDPSVKKRHLQESEIFKFLYNLENERKNNDEQLQTLRVIEIN